jgi:hypothetical protein
MSNDDKMTKVLEEMMTVLETVADRLTDMHLSNNRQFDELKALVAVRAGDQLPLFAVAAAAPASVVPNEDEAMPVLASCPTCGKTVYDEYDVEQEFGYRTPSGRETIVQSWCRECRALEQATSPRKCKPLPTHIADVGREARKLKKEANALFKKATEAPPKHQPDLLRQAASKAEESAAKQSQYNQERDQFRPRPPKPGKGNK